MNQLRSEQENFLTAYRFLTSVVSRILVLSEIKDIRKASEYLKLNFGSIQWEMDGFKNKVMKEEDVDVKNNNIWSGVNLEEYYNDYL